jgi:hypothetical protein
MNDQTGLSKNRVETLTDDIFAVAMTLLVLDISVPQISSNSSPTRIGKLRSREGDDAADIPYINPPLLAFVPATWTINKYTGDVLTELHFNIIET